MNKTVRHILSFAAFLIMLIVSIRVLDYLLVPMSRADFFLHDMERMKKKGPAVDMVIIGNSHYLYGLDPLIFEEELGLENAYNASVTGLEISSKYYITEAMINDFDPKIVLFDIDWINLYDRGLEITQSKLLGLDRLKGFSKIRHIFSDFYPSEMIYAFLRPYRYRDRIFWDGAVAGNIRLKRWAQSTKYEIDYYQTSKGYDKGMGCTQGLFPIESKGNFDESRINDQSRQYLDKIVNLCKEKNVSLFLVTTPVSTMQQMNIGNYQGALDYYSAYAKEKGVFFFDMNMLKNRDDIFNDNVMSDPGHLCETGAAIASKICAEIIRDELNGIDTGERFYSSMDELASDLRRIVAVGAEIEVEEDRINIKNLQATAAKDAKITFEITISEDDQNFRPVYRSAAEGESFEIPFSETASKTIYIKIIGNDPQTNTSAFAKYSINK